MHVPLNPAEAAVPRCLHYADCGGCVSQHLSREAQLAAKQQALLDDLERFGKLRPREVLDPVVGPAWGYRRRARLSARCVGRERRVLVGFSQKNRRGVTDTRRCEILDARIGTRMQELAAVLSQLSIADRIPQVEVAAGDSAVVLLLRVLEEPNAADRQRLLEFEQRCGLRVYLQPGRVADAVPVSSIPAHLDYALPEWGLRLEFAPGDFIQVNAVTNRLLVCRALELLQLERSHRVLDLFCGLGNFTLPLAKRARAALGVEGDEGLVERARANAACNGLRNASFHRADLFGDQRAADWIRQSFDRLLLDPPRAGAYGILEQLGARLPPRVVYVSCCPATLARDAGLLVHKFGYRLQSAGVVDMFPHTAHVEALAALEKAA